MTIVRMLDLDERLAGTRHNAMLYSRSKDQSDGNPKAAFLAETIVSNHLFIPMDMPTDQRRRIVASQETDMIANTLDDPSSLG